MATRKQASLLTNSESVLAVFAANLLLWIDAMRPSIALKEKHLSPNLALIVLAFRKANNVSGIEFGANRTRKGEPIVPNGDTFLGKHDKDSFFSLIANVEQGGRKQNVPDCFLEYVAAACAVDVNVIREANEQDQAIRTAFAASKRK